MRFDRNEDNFQNGAFQQGQRQGDASMLALLDKYNEAIAIGKKSGFQDRTVVDLQKLTVPVIVIGDIHGRIENLEAILAHDNNEQKIRNGEAVAVFLGDLIHPEPPHDLVDMGSSFEVLKRVMSLKIENPLNVYCLLGNHDFLRNGVNKGYAAQSVLFEQEATKQYTPAFAEKYMEAIEDSPLMALCNGAVLIHAGPIKSIKSLNEVYNEEIEDIAYHMQGEITKQATWARFGHGAYRYGISDVNRFLELCGHPEGMLLVGHSPEDGENYHWEIAGNHQIIHSGNEEAGYAEIKDGVVAFHSVNDERAQQYNMPEISFDPAYRSHATLFRAEHGYQPGGIDIIVRNIETPEIVVGKLLEELMDAIVVEERRLRIMSVSDVEEQYGRKFGFNPDIGYYLIDPMDPANQFKALREGEFVNVGDKDRGGKRIELDPPISDDALTITRKGDVFIISRIPGMVDVIE